MQQSNIRLRLALGIALFAFLLPFFTVSSFLGTFLSKSESFSGITLTIKGVAPLPFTLFALIIAFVLSFNKNPLGRWIGVFPLLAFASLAWSSKSGGNGFIEVSASLGYYLCLLASLVASILGFVRESNHKLNSLLTRFTLSPKEELPFNVEDKGEVAKILKGYRLILLALVLTFIGAVAGDKDVFAYTWLAVIVIGVFAFLKVGAVLRYEVPTRIVVSICILLPWINLFTLTVLAIKIGLLLKSNGVRVKLGIGVATKIQRFLINPVTKFMGK